MWFLLAFISVLILLGFFTYKFCTKTYSFWKNKGILQDKPFWLLGDSWRLFFNIETFTESIIRLYNKFPNSRYYGLYQFIEPVLLIRDPELIKSICIKDFDHFIDHRQWVPKNADPIWAHSLFSLQGERWKEMRSFLSPSFTGRKMRIFHTLMQKVSDNLLTNLKKQNGDIIEVDLKDLSLRYSCDVIATSAFGVETNSFEDKNNDFYTNAIEIGKFTGFKKLIFFVGFFLPNFLIEFFNIRIYNKNISNFFIDLVTKTIKIREENNIIRPDVIHLLIEARKGIFEIDHIDDEDKDTKIIPKNRKTYISDIEVTAQAIIFILGGLETLATLLRFLLYELAINPDVQNKLRKEILETKQNNDKITYEIVQKMKYLDMVVSECLRKWPVGSLLDRLCTKKLTIPAVNPGEIELTIDEGTVVWIPVSGIHLDPKYYPDPDKFQPERFSDENKSEINPYAYIPFGHGPRNCIGNRFALFESKMFLFYILSTFEIVPVEKSVIPLKLDKNSMIVDGKSFIFGFKKLV